jgi:phosphoribosylformimino-5-aminoimidazole carboxamide ribotide isomerase
MGGRVVQGLRGDRQRYRAVDSTLVQGCEPAAIAQALCRACEGNVAYVADLDAITGAGDHGGVIRELRERLGVEPWVDAGAGDAGAASRLAQSGAARVIVGTETLTDLGALRAIRDALPGEGPLVSLDVGKDGVLSGCRELAGRPPLDALGLLAAEGATEVILLALTRVGTATGPDLPTLRAARTAFPGLRLIAGGGVHTPDDLRRLAETGADGVLLATALHRGWITTADVRAVRSGHAELTSEP